MPLSKRTYFLLLALFLSISCVKSRTDIIQRPDAPKWEEAREYSYACEKAHTKGEKLHLSEKGIASAEACIKETPENAACYYFHAVNTGLYYQTQIIGYQKGLKAMVADSKKVVEMDPSYEHGGAYRILGLIYTSVPETAFSPDHIVRDLDAAIDNLRKAVQVAPDYPENYLALTTAFLKAENKEEAAAALKKAEELMPNWRDHADYPAWKKEFKKLAKKVGKNSHK